MKDYELQQKVLIFLIGVSIGTGRFIPYSVDIPTSFSEFVEIPVADFWGTPLVLILLVFLYIVAESMDSSSIAEVRVGESESVNEEESSNQG
jgi:hypothetical protein